MGRRFYLNLNNLISTLLGAKGWDAFFGQPKQIAGLGPLGNFKLFFTGQGWYHYTVAQSRLNKGYGNVADDIDVVSFKKFMGLHMNKDIKITWGAVVLSGLSFSVQSESGAVVHTGRYFYGNRFFSHKPAPCLDMSGMDGQCADRFPGRPGMLF